MFEAVNTRTGNHARPTPAVSCDDPPHTANGRAHDHGRCHPRSRAVDLRDAAEEIKTNTDAALLSAATAKR
jgi:hypothetical protein